MILLSKVKDPGAVLQGLIDKASPRWIG